MVFVSFRVGPIDFSTCCRFLLILMLMPFFSCKPSSSSNLTSESPLANNARSAEFCKKCHPMHYREWKGSVMHYSARSPTARKFEHVVRSESGNFGPHGNQPLSSKTGRGQLNSENQMFCIKCHAPLAARLDYDRLTGKEVVDKAFPNGPDDRIDQGSFFSELALEGVNCTVCHTVSGPEKSQHLTSRNPQRGVFNDGIANLSFNMELGRTIYGPFDPKDMEVENIKFHTEETGGVLGYPKEVQTRAGNIPYLSSSEFCGGCHDVRLPLRNALTQNSFSVLEDLFSEWQLGPYNSGKNPYDGKQGVVTCQDCHMSLFPKVLPTEENKRNGKLYPQAKIASVRGLDLPARKHAIHSFTAVSIPLVSLKDKQFPNRDTDSEDEFGHPKGQQQRRALMLRAAVEINKPRALVNSVSKQDAVLPVAVTVTNTGTGHRVPSGFSHEREMWIHLVAEDENEQVFYESGYLIDKPHHYDKKNKNCPGDCSLNDEDLEDLHLVLDPSNYEIDNTKTEIGPDYNYRPFLNRGLIIFRNVFLQRIGSIGFKRTLFPPNAQHIDNIRSLPMRRPVTVKYDIPLSRLSDGAKRVRVKARVRWRSFPPEFLRLLIERKPSKDLKGQPLVDEAMVDRNTIVDMTEYQESEWISVGAAHGRGGGGLVSSSSRPCASKNVSQQDGFLFFDPGGTQWLSLHKRVTHNTAIGICRSYGMILPDRLQLQRLGLLYGEPQDNLGFNKDDMGQELWTSEFLNVQGNQNNGGAQAGGGVGEAIGQIAGAVVTGAISQGKGKYFSDCPGHFKKNCNDRNPIEQLFPTSTLKNYNTADGLNEPKAGQFARTFVLKPIKPSRRDVLNGAPIEAINSVTDGLGFEGRGALANGVRHLKCRCADGR
jgi:hypothetical protein